MTMFSSMKVKAAAALAGCSLMLSGCLIQPGKFTSELMLLDDNAFTFTYEGEIHFVGLAKLAEESKRSSMGEFQAYCYGPLPGEEIEAEPASEAIIEQTTTPASRDAAKIAAEAAADAAEDAAYAAYSGDRECTPDEEAEQRQQWEERQQRRIEKDRKEAEQISQMFGGIDVTDPEAEKELAAILVRQRGFERVEAKGDGMFDVSYSITSTLQHDFIFPMFEGFPASSPFVQAFVRDGNVVRINAPGLSPTAGGGQLAPLMMGGGMFGGGSSPKDELNLPKIDGTFSIVTTGDIRANNTDEGPVTEARGKRLTWQINSRTEAAPTALIAM